MHLGEFTEAAEPPCDHGDRCESTLGGENERAVEILLGDRCVVIFYV